MSSPAKIRELVDDPETAELLCPDNVIGCKRLCVDSGYYETYNRPHVELVDVSQAPIERFSARGSRTDPHSSVSATKASVSAMN